MVVNGMKFLLLHNIRDLIIDPVVQGYRAVIYGHSHKPHNELKSGVLFFNPSSAGPRRFLLPIAVGEIVFTADELQARIVELDCG